MGVICLRPHGIASTTGGRLGALTAASVITARPLSRDVPLFDACHTTAVANAFLGDGALYMQYVEQLTHNHCVLWIGFFTNTVLTSTLVHCSGYARLCARSKLWKFALRMSTTHLPPYSHSLSIPSRGSHLLIIRRVARIPLLAVGSLSLLIVRHRNGSFRQAGCLTARRHLDCCYGVR